MATETTATQTLTPRQFVELKALLCKHWAKAMLLSQEDGPDLEVVMIVHCREASDDAHHLWLLDTATPEEIEEAQDYAQAQLEAAKAQAQHALVAQRLRHAMDSDRYRSGSPEARSAFLADAHRQALRHFEAHYQPDKTEADYIAECFCPDDHASYPFWCDLQEAMNQAFEADHQRLLELGLKTHDNFLSQNDDRFTDRVFCYSCTDLTFDDTKLSRTQIQEIMDMFDESKGRWRV